MCHRHDIKSTNRALQKLLIVGSYQPRRGLQRKVLCAVVLRVVLVQVGPAPDASQTLVRATHLTHGCVAHGAKFAGLSHQHMKEAVWVQLITGNPFPSPEKASHLGGTSKAPVPVARAWMLLSCPVWIYVLPPRG